MEYAFLKIELLFSTVACKPKIGSWRWVDEFIISDFCVRVRGVSVIVGALRWKKQKNDWPLPGPPDSVRMCNHLEDAAAGFWVVCEELLAWLFCGCVQSEFFLLYASSCYVWKFLSPSVGFIFRCLCAREKKGKKKLLQQFWLFKNLLPASYTRAIFFCLFILFYFF